MKGNEVVTLIADFQSIDLIFSEIISNITSNKFLYFFFGFGQVLTKWNFSYLLENERNLKCLKMGKEGYIN